MARPQFNATAALRDGVRRMKADGWSDDRIAGRLGINRGTLLKHFAMELEFGADAVEVEMLETMWAAAKRGNVSALRWLAKRMDAAQRCATKPEDSNEI